MKCKRMNPKMFVSMLSKVIKNSLNVDIKESEYNRI